MAHKRITAGMIAAFVILAGASGLFAQGGPAKPVERRGFYLSARAVSWSSLEFPSAYGTYKSIGGAAVPNQMYLETTGLFSSRPGFGLTAGYEFRYAWLTFGAEIEYARATVANGPERLMDLVGRINATTQTVRTFTQSGRTASLYDISLFFGAFPFRSFDLGFNITAGAGLWATILHVLPPRSTPKAGAWTSTT